VEKAGNNFNLKEGQLVAKDSVLTAKI